MARPTLNVPTFDEGAAISVADLVTLAARAGMTGEFTGSAHDAAHAAIRQASAWPNPELEIESGPARPRTGGDETTARLAIRQRIEAPGRRNSRITAASAGLAVELQEQTVVTLDRTLAVRLAAVDVAEAQGALTLAEASLTVAASVRAAVARRLAAGDADRGEALRAEIEEASVSALVEQRRSAVRAALAGLRQQCGERLPERFTIPDALSDQEPLPDLDWVLAACASHPRLLALRSALTQRQAEVARENRTWQPDLTVGAYAARGTDADEVGLTLGIELPLWERNQGGMAAAAASVRRVTAERERARIEIRAAVASIWHTVVGAQAKHERLVTEMVPRARKLFDLRQRAFTAGEIGLTDLLDARRTAQAAMEAEAEAAIESQRARLRLRHAIGVIAPTWAITQSPIAPAITEPSP